MILNSDNVGRSFAFDFEQSIRFEVFNHIIDEYLQHDSNLTGNDDIIYFKLCRQLLIQFMSFRRHLKHYTYYDFK